PDGTSLTDLDSLEERTPVSLRVSLGPVPAAAGQKADEAAAALQQVGLIPDFSVEQHSRDVPAGHLISVTVPDGLVHKEATISGIVSAGPVMVEVPDVVGRSIEEALQLLRDARL